MLYQKSWSIAVLLPCSLVYWKSQLPLDLYPPSRSITALFLMVFFGRHLSRQYCANQLLQSKVQAPALDLVGHSTAHASWIDLLGLSVCLKLFCTLEKTLNTLSNGCTKPSRY